MKKLYSETEAHAAFIVNADSLGYSFGDDDTPERIVKSFFAATAAYLSKVKVSKADEATALILTNEAGIFKFAGIVEYHQGNDDTNNWSFTMTFNEEDINNIEKKKKVNKHLYTTDAFKITFDTIAYDVGSIQFKHESYIYPGCLLVIDTIVQILDRESNTDSIDIEFPGYFIASCGIENGEKVMSITPDGHLKEIIKSDIALEM